MSKNLQKVKDYHGLEHAGEALKAAFAGGYIPSFSDNGEGDILDAFGIRDDASERSIQARLNEVLNMKDDELARIAGEARLTRMLEDHLFEKKEALDKIREETQNLLRWIKE